MSVKTNYNVEMPFRWLSRVLTGDPELKFVEMPAKQLYYFHTPKLWVQHSILEMAQSVPLPDDNDDDL